MKTKEGLQYELETVEIKPSPKEHVGQELIHKKKRVSVCERFCESRSGVSGGGGGGGGERSKILPGKGNRRLRLRTNVQFQKRRALPLERMPRRKKDELKLARCLFFFFFSGLERFEFTYPLS